MALHAPTLTNVTNYPIRRALLSVTDKSGLVEFARGLVARGVTLISTGGTARTISEAGIAVTGIEEVTGFPEVMHGRVKTLHPKVHGGLLALRDHPEHAGALTEHGIEAIDLVCVNLYAFEATVSKPDCTREAAVENIDIGGPSMIRSGAKNHMYVTVVTDPHDYPKVLAEMDAMSGATSVALRRELAAKAFVTTAAYDTAIGNYLTSQEPAAVGGGYPHTLNISVTKCYDLRHGENPHQSGALYRVSGAGGATLPGAQQLHGKELSYNNINDAAAALDLVVALKGAYPGSAAAACIKHTNPCGAALVRGVDRGATPTGESAALAAIDEAIAGDPVAAFGGIIACNTMIDAPAAARLCAKDVFIEVVIAPGFSPEALDLLRTRWANIRLLAVGEIGGGAIEKGDGWQVRDVRSIPGGVLVQSRDTRYSTTSERVNAAGPVLNPQDASDSALLDAAGFLEVVGKFLCSNAIVIGGQSPQRGSHVVRMFGGGAGQMDRVASCRLAVGKAGNLSRGAVAYSDAFFPFSDGPTLLADAGVRVIMHPGGSKRDGDTFELCNSRGITCLLSGLRHFRH
jgi:phosphoribosylaminoimidazolecarboxamide formyltransferase/IMP cyclohydrolase